MASQIQRATAEQTNGIHHVLDEMNNVATVIDRSLASSQDIQRATGELSSQASVLLHSVDRFKLPGREDPDSDDPFPGVHITELDA
jgi:methyl-accepting chemotaxis protein